MKKPYWIILIVLVLLPLNNPVTATETDPYSLISQDQMFRHLEVLTSIQPYSGWRNSASSGEAEARAYVTQQLEMMSSLDMEIEQQSFNVFVATEIHESRLFLTIDGQEIEVMADSTRGSRDNVDLAMRYDTDGVLNDNNFDPVEVSAGVQIIRTPADVFRLTSGDLSETILLVDFALIDQFTVNESDAYVLAAQIMAAEPAGVVYLTAFSDVLGESHGTGIGDVTVLANLEGVPAPQLLYARVEDLTPAGISSWDDLEKIEAVRMVNDVDVFAPGQAGNVIATIRGEDSSRAIILSAHIDSPNSPGALDDGTGSVALLEVARVLNEAEVRPSIDIVLAWFGGHEIGLYGSGSFVATHQELLDRSVAMLSVDCLTSPVAGVTPTLDVNTWSYSLMGNTEVPWAGFLQDYANQVGITLNNTDRLMVSSDNSSFNMYDVPNGNLGGLPPESAGEVHYVGFLHTPYDTLDRVRLYSDQWVEMVHIALAAALEGGSYSGRLRVTPEPEMRAVIVGSHYEAVSLTSVGMAHFGMMLAMMGYDVDLVPYGEPVTDAHLGGADMVLVLPVYDYPADGNDAYDTDWSADEVEALTHYVEDGGFLIITNAARRTNFAIQGAELNEDWSDMNTLSSVFGVNFLNPTPDVSNYSLLVDTPLMDNVSGLALGDGTAVSFELNEGGLALVGTGESEPIIAGLGYGDGLVMVLGDIGIFQTLGSEADMNMRFWFNLIRFVAGR